MAIKLYENVQIILPEHTLNCKESVALFSGHLKLSTFSLINEQLYGGDGGK